MAKAKQKPEPDEKPKVKGKPLDAPKTAAKKTVKKTVKTAEMKAKEAVKEQAKPSSDTDESPERYAENRIEQSAEYAVDRTKEHLKPSRHRSERKSEQSSKEEPSDNFPQRERPDSVEPKERPEPPQRSADAPTIREERSTEPLQRSPQTEQYQQRESAKKIISEKQRDATPRSQEAEQRNAVREKPNTDERDLPRDPDQCRSSEPAEPDLKERSNYTNEPTNPRIKEYQIEKYKEASKADTSQPAPNSRTIREKTSDVKELDRKAPSDHVRDRLTDMEPKEKSPEVTANASQQRQYAMEKYRNAIKERQQRQQADRYEPRGTEPESPAQGAVQPERAVNSQQYYSDYRPARMSNGVEAVQPSANARMPKMQASRSIKEPTQALSKVEKPAKATVKTAEKSVKATEKTIKTAERTTKTAVKTTERTAKTTAKTAQKTAQAAQKTAQAAAKTVQAAAKAAAQAAKVAAKAVASAIKAIAAGIKALIAAIAAGGWVAVIIIIVVALIAVLLSLCFGVFSSNDTQQGRPMTEAIAEINNDFVDSINAKIDRYKRRYKPDEVILIYEGDTDSNGSVMNWADVLGIYAVGTTTDPEQPTDVLIVTPDKVNLLRDYFLRMNSVSYKTELETEEVQATDDHGNPIFNEEGNPVMETESTLTITITVSSMDYRDAASYYRFDDSQMEMLKEIMQPEYYPMFAQLTGDVIGDGGEFGFGLDINPDLPPNELGYQIVQAAKRYIGRSYASMDCSTLCRTAYRDCGLNSMNGLSSVRMAQKCLEMGCLFTDASQLQAGDLIFFASLDPSRGKDYCRDRRRCGDGKCRRWMHIHHVAIYINDEFLIDSTGGDNSVQIRRLYGQDTKTLKWVCFGRPTT
jgi:hypothetical protein